jgi:hypothetical protein
MGPLFIDGPWIVGLQSSLPKPEAHQLDRWSRHTLFGHSSPRPSSAPTRPNVQLSPRGRSVLIAVLAVSIAIELVVAVLLGVRLGAPRPEPSPVPGVGADGSCIERPRVRPSQILAVRQEVRGYTAQFLEERGVGPRVAALLQSYQEHTFLYANLERAATLAGEAPVRLDPGLIELKRQGLREGAMTLLGPEEALRYERGYFAAWEEAWRAQVVAPPGSTLERRTAPQPRAERGLAR